MKKRRTLSIGLGITLTLTAALALMLAKDTLAWGKDWPFSSPAVALWADDYLEQRSAMALESSDRMAILWSESGSEGGAKICYYNGSHRTDPQLLTSPDTATLWPALVYHGTEPLAAWVEGGGITTPSTIVQMDINTQQKQTVMTGATGASAPQMVVGNDRAHMVFASAHDNAFYLQADIYYTSRDLNEATWATPTKVITYAQVTKSDSDSKIPYPPHLALSRDKQTLHLVWGQEQSTTSKVIYYMAGNGLSDGTPNWETPEPVSPDNQFATRPTLAVDASDQVHIAWVRPNPTAGSDLIPQNAIYKKLGASGEPTQLNDLPFYVNNQFPSLAKLSITSEGSNVCIAWHGFYEDDPKNKEEIWMRCSANGGTSWQGGINVSASDALNSVFGNIQMDTSGVVHATWVEFEIEGSEKVPQSLNVRSGPLDVKNIFLPLVMKSS
jgi:hypothetical protein